MDLSGVGYAYLFAGLAIWGAIVIFLLEIALKLLSIQPNPRFKILQAVLIILGICGLGIVAWFCTETGKLLINANKEQDQQNQHIIINMTCVGSNCTADIPNNLVISCPNQSCPPQNVCPTLTVIPTPAPRVEIYRCPWSLSMPKFTK